MKSGFGASFSFGLLPASRAAAPFTFLESGGMTKAKVTAQQRANAIEARDVLWPSVPPDSVVTNLRTWYEDQGCDLSQNYEPRLSQEGWCGTHACFGGWCAMHQPFREQGLARRFGAVLLTDPATGHTRGSGDSFLFGDDYLFNRRGQHEADECFEGTDHELVTHRLNWLIENSEVISDEQN